MIEFDFESKDIIWADKVKTLSKKEIEFVLDANIITDEDDLKILTTALNSQDD
jgi:hypothetical protein